jgi:peroxiredoxin
LRLPSVPLAATDGTVVDLTSLRGLTVVYAYPMTGRPDTRLPEGWDMIPGAKGCTPQSCAFRDHFAELRRLDVEHLFGLSAQGSEYQAEAAQRLHLPFPLLSDVRFELADALKLPSFEASGMRLLKRLTMIIRQGLVVKVFYPVFPPDQNAEIVVEWLKMKRSTGDA